MPACALAVSLHVHSPWVNRKFVTINFYLKLFCIHFCKWLIIPFHRVLVVMPPLFASCDFRNKASFKTVVILHQRFSRISCCIATLNSAFTINTLLPDYKALIHISVFRMGILHLGNRFMPAGYSEYVSLDSGRVLVSLWYMYVAAHGERSDTEVTWRAGRCYDTWLND